MFKHDHHIYGILLVYQYWGPFSKQKRKLALNDGSMEVLTTQLPNSDHFP